MNLIQLAIRQPVTVAVGVIMVLLAGVLALSRLPVALTPNVETMIVTVSTMWEGASPEEIEQNVVDRQEERLLGVSNLRLLSSSSAQGFGRVRLEFATGTDKEAAMREVDRKLSEVPDYPDGVDEPIVQATDEENRDYIAWIVFGTTDPSFDVRILRDFAIDRIEPVLERVKGVAEINVLGGREREVHIVVDPVRLAQYGISPTQFAGVIRATNQNISAGQLADGKLDVRLRTIGQFESLEQVTRTVILDSDGGQVTVGDVAEVVQTFKEPTSFVRSRGEQVIAINAEREIGSNVMQVMAGLKAEIGRLNQPDGLLDTEAKRLGLDGTLTLSQVYDQTVYIEDALALVRNNIWIGGTLAIIVLIIFLRSVRSVGIITLAIPISVVGAVVTMVVMGRSINVISLAGMAFAVGMVVDNAIVVLENIFRHLEMGKPARQAAYDGTREVWGAVLASTLTTVAVFVPILLIQEEAGQLFRDIALAICAAVVLSLVVAVTVIPAAAARIMRRGVRRRDERQGLSGLVARLVHLACGSVIARVAVIVVLTGVSIGGTVLLKPPADYLPTGNRNLIFGLIIPPPGYNIEQMEKMAVRTEATIRPFWEAGELIDDEAAYAAAVAALPEVPTFDWMSGGPGAPIRPPSIENYFMVAFGDILFHGAVSDEPRRVVDLMPLFSHATRADVLPGVLSFPLQVPLFQLGGSTGSAVKLQLAGPDLDAVTTAALALMPQLRQHEMFGQVQPQPSSFAIPGPEIQVRPDLVRLSELGLTIEDVGLAVRAAGDGAIIDDFHVGGEAIDLKIICRDALEPQRIVSLVDLPIATPSGHVVALGTLADIRRIGSPAEIVRVGRQRAIGFEVTPAAGVPLEEAMDELERLVASQREAGVIPPTVTSTLAGSASKLEDVSTALLGDGTVAGTLGSSLVLSLVVVYLLLCVLFQSFVRPMVIMFSVPLALLGGFLALAAVHLWSLIDPYLPIQKLDVLTMLGFVILIGVVVNNAILIVHQALNFMRGTGASADASTKRLAPRDAIAEAVRTRVRPIFMSTLTSVGGMTPLVLMPGSGSELYRGLGSVVVGGLLVSTIFTIVLVPMLLSLVTDLQQWLRRQPATAPVAAATAPGMTRDPS